MERRRFFAGLFLMVGLILGSLFTNFVYKDYLAYGGQIDSLVLNNKDLYVSSASLLPYILFKRGKQYGILFLAGYLLQPLVFYLAVCSALLFPRLHAVSPDHSDGAERPDHSSVWLFPAFYMLWHFCSAFVSQECAGKSKEGTDFYYGSRSFSERFSVQLEIILVIIGCILESYANPVLMEEVLKLFA